MKSAFSLFCTVALIAGHCSAAEPEFKPLFNGKDLTGWDGNPELWKVEDGCIVGATTGPDQLGYNQFLIWRGGTLKNFELRVKCKLTNGNSGIQYRSRELKENGPWSIGGYQCDIVSNPDYHGMLFGERGGGMMAFNGCRVTVDDAGEKWLTGKLTTAPVPVGDWNDYTVIARGNQLTHKINGQTVAAVIDHHASKRALEGLLAFQLHRGPAMKVAFKDVFLKSLPDGGLLSLADAPVPASATKLEKPKAGTKPTAAAAPVKATATAAPPTTEVAGLSWLWSQSPAARSSARLKKEFDLAGGELKEAILRVACDNGAKVFLNDKLVLTNPDWNKPSQVEVRAHLRPGRNELRAEATNQTGAAGFVAALTLRCADGTEQVIGTDATWLAAPPDSESWEATRVVKPYGEKPWGDVFAAKRERVAVASAAGKNAAPAPNSDGVPTNIQVAPGFEVELIYSVPKETQGSWVALTVDDRGRFIASDQHGGLYRLTPPPLDAKEDARVEKLDADITGAHGLLYAFDSLYVMVNEQPNTSGLWRLRDTKGSSQFDEKTLLRELKGRGEHGVHGLALSPDGRSIYIACGNGTRAPEPLEHIRLSRPLGDDQVLPRVNRGGEFSETKPHAFTCKVSPDGQRFELVAAGMRNHYDIAFNALGDLFTYDSDMEWDVGTPWYRPTRICQLVSGADFGFRENSGKLPEYYPDTVPPLANVGPGSPTGLVSGHGARFPMRYQHAIFAADWTYGTLYAVHLTPDGASYRAELEEFITGKPLPFTDVVIGRDGAMYFTVGGRRTQSAVYRVTYVGDESTAPAPPPVETPEHRLRVELERLHDEGTGPEVIDKAWPHLGHRDRFVRWAARVAIERQPVNLWAARAANESDTQAGLEACVAFARMGGREHQPALLERLNRFEFGSLEAAQQLALVRAYQITIARDGVPDGELRTKAIARLDASYPAKSNDLNRELSRTLVALDAPGVVAKTLRLLAIARDDEQHAISAELLARNDNYGAKFLPFGPSRPCVQQIALAYALRATKSGWTSESRHKLFEWFASTARWQGGNQFRGFIDQIRAEALAKVPDAAERASLEALSKFEPPAVTQTINPPKGPGRNYTVDDVVALAKDGLHKRSFARGRELFMAAACLSCHKIGNSGGGVGPDLTGSGSRYTARDLIENIIDPSKVISDQYESSIIERRDGSIIAGRITAEESGTLFVAANPVAPGGITEVKTSDIKSRRPSPVSLMPAGLINTMNESEVLDLLAYIMSGGDTKSAMFR